jgi:HK97 family phage major capsid protein
MDVTTIRSSDDLRGRTPAELLAIRAEMDNVLRSLHDRGMDDGQQAEWDKLLRLRDECQSRIDEHARISDLYNRHPGAVVRAFSDSVDRAGWVTAPGADPQLAGYRRSAMDTLDRYCRVDVMDAGAADRVDGVLRAGDPQGLTARYLAAVGAEAYASAFGKMLADPATGHLRFSTEEVEAVRAVTMAAAAAEYRAGPLITGSTGFPLPLTVDPSIIMSGAGALNPIRGLATVVTIGTHDWVGVSSAGVTASYDQEGTEVSDDTPDLAGPKISTQRGTAFVPVSIEATQDWPSVQAEMARLVADARDVLDATAFLTGNGTNQPFGIFGGDATYSLATTQRVLTATTATLAVADPWSLKAQIPARFLGRTTFVAHPSIFDTIFRFVGGNSTEPYQFSNGDRAGDFLGRPKAELSTLVTTTTSGSKVVVGGDWATAYRIVDRIGMSVEIVPHLVGASHRPTGQRGIFCYWRTGAGVVAANALRYTEVK